MSIEISSKFEGQLLPEIKLSISRPCWNTRCNTTWNTHRNFCRILQIFQNLQKKRILAPRMMPKKHDLNKIKQNTFCQKYANTKKTLTISSPFGNFCKTPKFQKLTKQTPPTYNIYGKK